MDENKRISLYKTKIDTSPKEMEKETYINSRKIRTIFKDDKFKKLFGVKSIEENYERSKVKYPVQAEIEDLIKLILKNYDDLEQKEKGKDARSFMEHNNQIMKDIETLDEYQKRYIKAHSSYKYNQIMNEYYEKFIERIVVLISMFLSTDFRNDGIEDDSVFRKVIFSLDEVIRQFSLNNAVGRTKSGFNAYSMNNAIKDVIKFSERDTSEYYTKILTDILNAPDNEYQIMENNLPNQVVPGLKEEYLKRTNEEKLREMNCEASYKELIVNKEEIAIDWKKYFNDYSYYFVKHAMQSNISRYDELHKHTYQYTDLYGRMLRHNICDRIDKAVEITDEFLNGNKEADMLVKHMFYEEGFLSYENERIFLNYNPGIRIEEKDVFKYYPASANVRKITTTVIAFIEKCREDKLEELGFGERFILTEFFRCCIGIKEGLNFKFEVQKLENKFREDKQKILDRENYKSIAYAINKSIGEIWWQD